MAIPAVVEEALDFFKSLPLSLYLLPFVIGRTPCVPISAAHAPCVEDERSSHSAMEKVLWSPSRSARKFLLRRKADRLRT